MDFYLNHAFLIKQLKGGLPLELSARELALYLDRLGERGDHILIDQDLSASLYSGLATYPYQTLGMCLIHCGYIKPEPVINLNDSDLEPPVDVMSRKGCRHSPQMLKLVFLHIEY